MQVSFRTAANAWPSNHPKKRFHFYSNDLMILFQPFSIFTCFNAFTSVRPASEARSCNELNHMFLVQGPPGDMSRSQASSCLVVCENTLLAGMYLYDPLSPNLTETIQVLQTTSGIFRTQKSFKSLQDIDLNVQPDVTDQSNCMWYLK